MTGIRCEFLKHSKLATESHSVLEVEPTKPAAAATVGLAYELWRIVEYLTLLQDNWSRYTTGYEGHALSFGPHDYGFGQAMIDYISLGGSVMSYRLTLVDSGVLSCTISWLFSC